MLPFRAEEKIAQGGFGEVWKGVNASGETVAVKFLKIDRAGPGFLELFKREFAILSEIRHVHLARVFDFGFDPGRNLYFFTQEYCPGVPLQKAAPALLKDGFGGMEEILVQVLSALDYIHSQGIIHSDVKPENILVGADDEGRPHARLVDFGISARLGGMTGGRGGTLAYMAPELFDKTAAVDHRVDLYALGMSFFQVLAGGLPFTEMMDSQEVILWHQKGRISDAEWERTGIPKHLQEVLSKLLRKKPSDRFSSAKVVLNFLNLSTGRKYLKEEEGLLGQIPTEGPLVERRSEVIEPLLKKLGDGSGPAASAFVTVFGERGMGKTRVLDEIRHALELQEIPLCLVNGDWQVPVWPRLCEWLGLAPLPESEMGEGWRVARRAEAVIDAAQARPFCFMVDDAHKADSEMKALLAELKGRIEAGVAPGLKIVTSMDEEVEDSVALRRISPAGVGEYVRQVLGEAPGLDGLAALLRDYSGGLPVLMVEGLKFLGPHFARGESLEHLLPPPEVGELYRAPVASLTDAEREVLYAVALFFRPVKAEELSVVLGRSVEDVVLDSLACVRKGLLAEGVGEGAFRVSSQALALGLIRTLDTEQPEKRRNLHRKIAQGLQSRPTASPREIAYHLAKCGEVEKAALYFREAAKGFQERGQVAAATDCLIRAIDGVGEASPVWEGLVLEAVRLLTLSGEYDQAASFLRRLETHPSSEREELHGWIAFKRRRFPEAREYYARALQGLPAGDWKKRIYLENALGNVDLQEGRPFEASQRFRKTMEWEPRLGPQDRIRINNNNLGLALSLMGDLPGAEKFYRNRLEARRDQMDASEELSCQNGLGYVLIQACRYEEAAKVLMRATELAERTGAMHSLFSSMGNLVTALVKEGCYADSLPYLHKMLTHQQRLGTLRDLAYNYLRQGDVYLTLGMSEAAHDAFQKGQKAATEAKQPALAAWILLMEGYWQREFGDPERSRQLFLQTELDATRISQEDLATWSVFALADLAYERGEVEEARRHWERILPINGDEEFAARMRLLTLKVSPPAAKQDVEAAFADLEKTCQERHFREILWELYEAWGRKEQAAEVVVSIAESLPEEYRDRYLSHGGRQRVLQAFQKALDDQIDQTSKGLGFRMRKLLAPLKRHLHLH
ncbi:MAG TPA: protein kinase [bacterium]|nr:protein kinase [bacterium]